MRNLKQELIDARNQYILGKDVFDKVFDTMLSIVREGMEEVSIRFQLDSDYDNWDIDYNLKEPLREGTTYPIIVILYIHWTESELFHIQAYFKSMFDANDIEILDLYKEEDAFRVSLV